MDGADFDETATNASFRFIERTNRLFGGIAVVRDFVRRQIQQLGHHRTFCMLDLGAGSCDIAAAVAQWANRKGIGINITCVEKNPFAVRRAMGRLQSHGIENVRVETTDVFDFRPTEPVDCIVAAMLLHHFDEAGILRLLHHMWAMGPQAILISDLHRSMLAYATCWVLTRRSHPIVEHDVLLSIRKGFREGELRQLLSRFGRGTFTVSTTAFCRVRAEISLWSER